MKKNKKFCPKCGTPNNISDSYCIHCGYSFRGKRKGLNFKSIIILVIIIIIGWIILRIFLKKPIIPQELMDWIDTLKNMNISKTG